MQVQGRAVVGDQGAKPPEAPGFSSFSDGLKFISFTDIDIY
jgi:hypothetical protein